MGEAAARVSSWEICSVPVLGFSTLSISSLYSWVLHLSSVFVQRLLLSFSFFLFLPSKNLSNFVVWTRSEEQLGVSFDSSCEFCRFFDFVLTSLESRSSNVFGKEIPIGFWVLRIFSSAACSSSFGEAQLSSAQQLLQRLI